MRSVCTWGRVEKFIFISTKSDLCFHKFISFLHLYRFFLYFFTFTLWRCSQKRKTAMFPDTKFNLILHLLALSKTMHVPIFALLLKSRYFAMFLHSHTSFLLTSNTGSLEISFCCKKDNFANLFHKGAHLPKCKITRLRKLLPVFTNSFCRSLAGSNLIGYYNDLQRL